MDENDKKINVRDEATSIVSLFEDLLDKYDIRVPSDEDFEREPDATGLYGTQYYELLDEIEYRIADLLTAVRHGAKIVSDFFPEES